MPLPSVSEAIQSGPLRPFLCYSPPAAPKGRLAAFARFNAWPVRLPAAVWNRQRPV